MTTKFHLMSGVYLFLDRGREEVLFCKYFTGLLIILLSTLMYLLFVPPKFVHRRKIGTYMFLKVQWTPNYYTRSTPSLSLIPNKVAKVFFSFSY